MSGKQAKKQQGLKWRRGSIVGTQPGRRERGLDDNASGAVMLVSPTS